MGMCWFGNMLWSDRWRESFWKRRADADAECLETGVCHNKIYESVWHVSSSSPARLRMKRSRHPPKQTWWDFYRCFKSFSTVRKLPEGAVLTGHSRTKFLAALLVSRSVSRSFSSGFSMLLIYACLSFNSGLKKTLKHSSHILWPSIFTPNTSVGRQNSRNMKVVACFTMKSYEIW